MPSSCGVSYRGVVDLGYAETVSEIVSVPNLQRESIPSLHSRHSVHIPSKTSASLITTHSTSAGPTLGSSPSPSLSFPKPTHVPSPSPTPLSIFLPTHPRPSRALLLLHLLYHCHHPPRRMHRPSVRYRRCVWLRCRSPRCSPRTRTKRGLHWCEATAGARTSARGSSTHFGASEQGCR